LPEHRDDAARAREMADPPACGARSCDGAFRHRQRGTFNGKLYWVWTPINTAGNAFGPFVNRNHFAGWMLMAAALTAGYLCSLMVQRGPRRQLSWRQRLGAMTSSDANRLLFASCALAVMALSIVWTLSRRRSPRSPSRRSC
jgi:hypothetical protein